jgi:hypothetical protein
LFGCQFVGAMRRDPAPFRIGAVAAGARTAAGVDSERSPTPEPEGDVVGQRAEDADRKRAP